jgi:hypothetical protein
LALSEEASNSPNSLAGTWAATFKNGDRFSGLSVGGIYPPNGYGIMLYVQTPPPPCETGPGVGSAPLGYTMVNVVVTSTTLTAAVGRISCNGVSFGTVNLSRH